MSHFCLFEPSVLSHRPPFCAPEPLFLSPRAIFLSPRAKRGGPLALMRLGKTRMGCRPERKPRGLIPSASLMSYEGLLFSMLQLIFFCLQLLKKRAKAMELIEVKLKKELQEIKAQLLQLLKHDEQSESKTSYFFYSLFLLFCILF